MPKTQNAAPNASKKMKSGKGKGWGGSRRTCQLGCGHIIRGVHSRLKAAVRCHQKVCSICAQEDLSYIWLREPDPEQVRSNLTDLKSGGVKYGTISGNKETTSKMNVLRRDTGEEFVLDAEGATTDNLTGICGEMYDQVDFDIDVEKIFKKETKTQKKRRMRKNKKEREFNASIGLGEKTDLELDPFEFEFKLKKSIQ